MKNDLSVKRIIDSRTNPSALNVAYDEFLQSLVSESLWSAENPIGSRIPWRLAAEAAKHASLADAFRLPGIYLFGNSTGIPRYVGMTRKQTLWKRLRGRYVHGKESQCQLAVDYQSELTKRGLEGFPVELREKRRRTNTTARQRGAVEFAKNGIEGMWFALIPVADNSLIPDLEANLISIANAWNNSHGHPPLINVRGA